MHDGRGSGQRPSSHIYLYQVDATLAACGHFGDPKRERGITRRRGKTKGKRERERRRREASSCVTGLVLRCASLMTLEIQFRLRRNLGIPSRRGCTLRDNFVIAAMHQRRGVCEARDCKITGEAEFRDCLEIATRFIRLSF